MSDKKSIKKRNWGFILYLDSAPSNWKSILENTGLPIAVSPIHDQDTWTEEDEKKDPLHKAGSLKKAHYHVLLHYSGPTTYQSVCSICDSVCASKPIPIESLKGSYAYLTHEFNEDKAQYSEDDILLINGFRIQNYAELTADEVLQIKKDIHRLILDMDITEYSDLMNYLLVNELDAEYKIANNSTIYFGKLIDSIRHKRKEGN